MLVLANALATVLRFVAFRSWIFAAPHFPEQCRMTATLTRTDPTPPPATPPGAARRDRLAFAGLLVATAALYLVNLSANGWGNDFYAAAVQSMTKSWEAFFFGSFDAGNVVTVDKPPAALWVMALSARVFGLSSWSILVPQALMAVATVALLYAAVRRVAGPGAALLAGAAMALTPVAVLMFRFDNPDALLVLLMVAAAYAVVRAVEQAGTRWLLLAGALLGLAFLTKTAQALLVLPALAAAYLWAAPTGLWRRVRQLLAAGLAMVVVGGWWFVAVALWPAADRPYIGGSTNNSAIELALGYNGLGRIFGQGGFGGGRGGAADAAGTAGVPAGAAGSGTAGVPGGGAADAAGGFPVGPGGFGGGGGGPFGGNAGLGRLFANDVGGQIAWLLPAALALLVIGMVLTRRAPRTDRLRASLIVWGGWTVVTALVFSLMEGIFHQYYTVALAPGDRRAGRHRWGAAVAAPSGRGSAVDAGGAGGGHGGVGVGAARAHTGVRAVAAVGHRRGRRGRGGVAAPSRPGPCGGGRGARGRRGVGPPRTGRLRGGHRGHREQGLDPARGPRDRAWVRPRRRPRRPAGPRPRRRNDGGSGRQRRSRQRGRRHGW